MQTITTDALEVVGVDEEEREYSYAELVFYGVDHSGDSYEARVFLENSEASIDTPRDIEAGYAGSFSVFGHGGCYGEEGHCDVDRMYRDEFDLRPPHPLTPLTKTADITTALRKLGKREVRVTVVAADHEGEEGRPTDALKFERVRLLLYET